MIGAFLGEPFALHALTLELKVRRAEQLQLDVVAIAAPALHSAYELRGIGRRIWRARPFLRKLAAEGRRRRTVRMVHIRAAIKRHVVTVAPFALHATYGKPARTRHLTGRLFRKVRRPGARRHYRVALAVLASSPRACIPAATRLTHRAARRAHVSDARSRRT